MTQINPYFSIIIPTLNEEKYIAGLLSDLTSQSYRDFEVIVVDGKSSDQTVSIVQKYTKLLPHSKILTSPKRHVCVQRNLGAKKAKGEYLVFMDADNRIPSYFLLGIKYQLELEPTDLLTTWIRPDIMNPSNNALATSLNLFFELNFKLKPNFLLESMIIIKKTAFHTLGGFNENTMVEEGRDLINQIYNNNYTYRIVNTPTYQYSFRRIRKYGAINMAGRVAQTELLQILNMKNSSIIKSLYPMQGGKQFDQKQNNLLIQIANTNSKNRSKFNKKIRSLITILNTKIDIKSLPLIKRRIKKLLS